MKDNKELLEGLKAGLFNDLIVTFEMYTGPSHLNYRVTGVLQGIDWQGKWHLRNSQNNNVETCNWGSVQPHYFPLSMLTKPIKVSGYNDGKEFVPIKKLQEVLGAIDEDLDINTSILHSSYIDKDDYFEIVDLLDQWHLNRFDLDTEKFIDASISKVYDND